MSKVNLFPQHVPLQEGSIIILTGAPGSGKTTAGTSIAPRSQLAYIDCEASGVVAMAGNPPAYHRDVIKSYNAAYPDHKVVNNVKYVDMIFSFFDEVEAASDTIAVLTLDNTAKLKAAGLEWAQANPKLVGLNGKTKVEFAWGAWNNYLTERLQRLALKVGILVIIVHLQDEYENNKPTGVLSPRIWEKLEQAASLIWWLKPGQFAPVPDALLRKGRAVISVDVMDGQVFPDMSSLPLGVQKMIEQSDPILNPSESFEQVNLPIFPPVIRGFNWNKVREYMNAPYDILAENPQEIPTQEERNIINGVPSDLAVQGFQAYNAEVMMAAKAAKDEEDKRRSEITSLFFELGDHADDAKAHLKAKFGGYSAAVHDQCVAELKALYPSLGSPIQ